MKIIYEVGDTVEIEDNMEVPHELGAATVTLLAQLDPGMFMKGKGNWTVEVVEGWGISSGGKFTLNEKWFIP